MDGWKVEPKDHLYDEESIFSYINGSGEVYRAYNMKACLSRRYVNEKGERIILDVFLMGSSQDAFGVFTHELAGTALTIGQGALYRKGWLRWWKGPFFVSLMAETPTEASEKAVVALGRKVATMIRETGDLPPSSLCFLKEGLDKKGIRYLHHPVILNYHYYIANENILVMDHDTDAVLGTYERKGKQALFLLILYPTRERAREAHLIVSKAVSERMQRRLIPYSLKTKSGVVRHGREGCWPIVLEAQTLGLARDLLLETGGSDGSD